MVILGISGYYHDSAAALIRDGKIIAAAQEERFTRRKHDAAFPHQAIRYCLDEAGITGAQIDHVAFYDKPFLKFERLLETYLAFAPRGFRSFRMAIPIWLREKLFLKSLLTRELRAHGPQVDWDERLLFSEHHLSHAASAYYPSPFNEAVILTLDGVGEWATSSLALGSENQINILKEIHFPHSLGLLYSAFTYHCGFKVNSGEYKLMGLAPYGQPRYAQTILEHLIDVKSDGSFRLNMDYFDYCVGLTMTNTRFANLFAIPARQPEAPLTEKHMDMAASIQAVTEEVMLRLTRSAANETGVNNLCLAGGVALNCVANGKVLKDGGFKQIWIQPAAGDAGGALGAALSTYHGFLNHSRRPEIGDSMQGTYLGPAFTDAEIANRLTRTGAVFETLSDEAVVTRAAQHLANGKAVGWFQGRMEFGPRALGARSILADPRSPSMQSTLNLKVKFRESFRPFAPSVLREDAAEWFDLDTESPYMLLVAEVREAHQKPLTREDEALTGLAQLAIPRSDIPAVTHVDHSARIQTVGPECHPRYYSLLSAFKQLTGCPVLINTSFNVRGEPIVCTPEDAFRCFMGTDIDVLIVGNCYLEKPPQRPELRQNYQHAFSPD
jgi:carbamoyltransferase